MRTDPPSHQRHHNKQGLEALTMNVELISRDVESLRQSAKDVLKAVEQDGEHIRALVRIVEIHERRI